MISPNQLLMTLALSIVLPFTTIAFNPSHNGNNPSPLTGKVICIDPGHGGTADTDMYRVGPAGEREEWINLRVALFLKELLEEYGSTVLMTRTEDVHVSLQDRAQLAVDNDADVFISVHHNATADSSVNFPIVYYHGNASENQASVLLGKQVINRLREYMFDEDTPVSLVSDHTIFPTAGTGVLRHSYGIPGIIAEASFFTNPEEEQRLKGEAYNKKEAEAFLHALIDYFSIDDRPGITERYSTVRIEPFPVLQEAERMSEEAKHWHMDFKEGLKLMEKGAGAFLQEAYELFTQSARSFPDSYIAGKCHHYRAEILGKLGKPREAQMERNRVKEFYPLH